MKPPRRLFRERPPRPPETPHYLPAVIALGKTATPGAVNHINVFHDHWCRIFKGKPCDCKPTVRRSNPERN